MVIGAGAAGLMAAIFAARSGARAVALDGAKKIGAKILISGGGRCNVTHDEVGAADFNGNRNAIAKVLRTFDVEATIAFFESLGVMLKREPTGKLFPVTNQARTVLEALLDAARVSGAEVRSGWRVEGIKAAQPVESAVEAAGQVELTGAKGRRGRVTGRKRDEAPFLVRTEHGTISASRIVIATGGRSVAKTGSDGFGYELATALGHTIVPTLPALVPLVFSSDHWLTRLRGTSANAELSVRSESGRVLRRERGSLLFTHFGVSGPVVLDMSRHWIAAGADGGTPVLVANVIPEHSFESLEALLIDEAKRKPRATIASALRGMLAARIVEALARSVDLDATTALVRLTRDERRRLVRAFVELPLPVVRDRGFDYAEVTAGGVPLDEIDVGTMQSRLCPGAYLCGEILDVDGRIGGYNFQWAWASGRLAGMSAGDRVVSPSS